MYADVLYNILFNLNKTADHDLPTVNEASVISYVKDAFGISESKHNESYERVRRKESPDIEVDGEITDDSGNISKQTRSYNTSCFITPKVNNFEALESHCCLLQILLKHELELSQTPYFYWSGKFSFLAATVLSLHSESKYLTEINLAFAKWAAYAEIHQWHPLDLKIFLEILDFIIDFQTDELGTLAVPSLMTTAKVLFPTCFGLTSNIVAGFKDPAQEKARINELKSTDEQVIKMFWDGASKLNTTFLKFFGALHETDDLQYNKIEILQKSFMILNKMKIIEPPIDEKVEKIVSEETLKESIMQGTSKYLSKIINIKKLRHKRNNVRLDELIRIMEVSTESCTSLSDRFGSHFEE